MNWILILSIVCSAFILTGLIWCCGFIGSKHEKINSNNNDKKNKN